MDKSLDQMAAAMRLVSEKVKRYDFENDDAFTISEMCRKEVVVEELEGWQMVIDWDNLRTSNGCGCAERHAAPSECAENAVENAVPPADNMGLPVYQYLPKWGGYDGGVEASLYGKWEDFAHVTERLEACKKAADDGRTDDSFIEFGGFLWLVRPTGASTGFFKYKWVMESHGVKLYIHSNPKRVAIPVRVRFGFECLARTDLFEAVETLRHCLRELGFDWQGETLSRVDMQVLLPVDISEFAEAMRGRRVVTRCRGKFVQHSSLETMRIETMTLASSACELCIYDKNAHLFDAADAVYFDTFRRHILHSEKIPEKLTRVEFRFRRDALKRYGVDTFADLKRSQAALPQIAGTDWFRILERDKVRGSENEIGLAPIWQRTLDAFAHYFTPSEVEKPRDEEEIRQYRPPKNPAPGVQRLLRQAVGCVCSAAALSIEKVTDWEQVAGFFGGVLSRLGNSLYLRVAEKQVRTAIARGYTPGGGVSYTDGVEVYEGLQPIFHPEFLQYET
ncbi:MAG: hypothetical protein Q4D62_15590 [Planctomycetia bacterium]|nr:hypothetical protein [Planctomycetia bacterium]